MPVRRLTHRLPLVLATGVAAALGHAPAALADALSPESGPTPNANAIDTLYWIVFVLGLIIFFAVTAVIVYCMVRFRARKGAVAAQIRGNTRLEIGWTVGAALVLVVLAVVTFITLGDIRNPIPSDEDGPRAGGATGTLVASADRPTVAKGGDELEIQVTGLQYLWRYTYPDGDDNPLNNPFSYEEMVVPVGRTVVLRLEAQDVIHSWWIPKLGGKFDATPGHVNWTWFQATEPGEWEGQCAELCGRGHANMYATVRAVPPAEYEAYIEQRKAAIEAANREAADARAALEEPDEPQQQGGEESQQQGGEQTESPNTAPTSPGQLPGQQRQ